MEDTRELTIDKSKLFFTTTDVCKILKIGRKKRLALFHREDFPCLIYGKTILIEKNSFINYFKNGNVILADKTIWMIENEKIESVENREKAEKEIAKNKYKNRIR